MRRLGCAEPARILHFVPADGIGGVENAARAAAARHPDRVSVLYLSSERSTASNISVGSSVSFAPYRSSFDLRNLWHAFNHARRIRPNVVVCSLWKTAPIFILLRLLFRNRCFVVFLHSDRPVHLIDALANKTMLKLADAAWADSPNIFNAWLASGSKKTRRRVSMLLQKLSPPAPKRPNPSFIYWGRLNRLKRIDLALDLFADIAAQAPAARFLIIGPDSGQLANLQSQVETLGLLHCVTFLKERDISEIVSLSEPMSFFVQLSDQEGSAMSVMEAMQLGLVPVVTAVGAIPTYCRHMENGIIYTDKQDAVHNIMELLSDESKFQGMSKSAAQTFSALPTYGDDLVLAAEELLGAGSPASSLSASRLQ